MSKPTDRAFPLLGKPQLLISLAMLTTLLLALTAGGEMEPASSFSATNDCLIGTNFPISQASGRQEVPAIAYNGQKNEYLVVWQSKESPNADSDICGQVVLDSGSTPDERDFCILISDTDNQEFPVVAYNSNNCQYLVVWQDDSKRDSEYPGRNIYGQLISCTPETMGTPFPFFRPPGRAKDQLYPAVAYNSTDNQYLVVWEDKSCPSSSHTVNDIYGWRVDSEGNLIGDVIPISIATDCESDDSVQQSPAVAYNSQDNQYLVVWEDNRNGNGDIYGQVISTTGTLVGGNFYIVEQAGQQRYPDLAYNSQDNLYLVVWQDNIIRDWEIYGRWVKWVKSDGTWARGIVFRISSGDGSEQNPAVAYNNGEDEYLVVWQDNRSGCEDIYGQRVGSDDSLRGDECPISTVEDDQEYPDVAYNSQNSEYMVVWQDERNGEDNDDIYGQRVRSAPTPTSTLTNTITPTSTVTPTPYRLYLPIIMKNYAIFCNGGFETGTFSCWTPGGVPTPSVVDHLYNNGDPPYSGKYCALLGEELISCEKHDSYRSWIYQDFTIPADAPSPTLTFAYRIVTNDILAWASFRVEIRNLNNVPLAQVLRDGSPDIYICHNDLGWRRPYPYDLSQFKGMTVRLWFEVRNEYDGGLGIWTYVDDVTVTP